MRTVFFSFILLLFITSQTTAQPLYGVIRGHVMDAESELPLFNCNIVIEPGNRGTTTDSTGAFTYRLPFGNYRVLFRYLGYEAHEESITLSASQSEITFDIDLESSMMVNQEVTYVYRHLSETTIQELEETDIRRVPTVYADVLRSIKILPGVSSNNELSSAYNVRGGNFDENLIYLNGYEIYRPFLLREGVEENLSLVNLEMVEETRFHGGAFPARYGDKMSSALEVDYKRDHEQRIQGTLTGNLLYQSAVVHNRIGDLGWIAGVRYSTPERFVEGQQTSGKYSPEFIDGQLLVDYRTSESSSLDLFLLSSNNSYTIEPDLWEGHYGPWYDPRAVKIYYDGERSYSTRNNFAGLRFTKRLTQYSRFYAAVSYLNTVEEEDIDLYAELFEGENDEYYNPQQELLKTRTELADNLLELNTSELQVGYEFPWTIHAFSVGANLRRMEMQSRVDESFTETSESLAGDAPHIVNEDRTLDLNSYSVFLQDDITFSPQWQATVGVRYLHYDYTGENLLSPRAGIYYKPSLLNTLSFNWGYYYQPPFFYELRNKPDDIAENLRSQLAIHYILGWEHNFGPDLTLTTAFYYKQLDNLIPYYMEQMRLEYEDDNNMEGYAKGFDLMIQGKIVERLNSWLGYSYLDTRERFTDRPGGYQRRALDQTHTLRFFLQDQMPQLPFMKAHLRILFGSGYRYHPRSVETDDATGLPTIEVDYDYTERYQYYARFDAGFSAEIPINTGMEIYILGEVLNMFNHTNVANYSWINILPGSDRPTRIAQIYPGRFFNLGVELRF